MTMPVLHTIGYEGGSIDAFVSCLVEAGVQLLIDVRDLPLSRKRGFSKRALAEHLEAGGIGYLHLRGLGDPKPGRLAAREGRIEDFRRIFRAHLATDAAQDDLDRAVTAAQGEVACLLCFERDHLHCHRCIVAEEMVRRSGFRLHHLVLGGHVASRCGHVGAVAA